MRRRRTHYEALGLSRDATVEEVNAAYYSIVRPMTLNAQGSDAAWYEATRAWRVLSKEMARASYDAELAPQVYEEKLLRYGRVSCDFQPNDEVRHPTDGIGRVVRIPALQAGTVHLLVKFSTGIRKIRAEDVTLLSRDAPAEPMRRPAQGESASAALATFIPDVTQTRVQDRRRVWNRIEERRLDGSRALRDDDRRTTDGRLDSFPMHDDYDDDADP